MTVTPLIADSVWDAVEEHVFSTTAHEVGGVLVGRVDGTTTHVTAILPALEATAGSANVTFTHAVWESVHRDLDRDHPDERIVGWYHSHPGFGIFLSEYDLFAHTSFFDDPAMLALVIDPLSGEAGWFGSKDGEVEQLASRRTVREPIRPAAQPSPGATPQARLGTLALAVAAALAVGFFAGGSLNSRTVVKPTQSAEVSPVAPTPAASRPAPTASPAATTRRAAPSVPGPSVVYRVRRGDSLWSLSAAFYGNPRLWPGLRAKNPQLPSSRLSVGQRLTIPARLEPAP